MRPALLLPVILVLSACAAGPQPQAPYQAVQQPVANDGLALNKMGLYYLNGVNGYPKDYQKSNFYFLKSAQLGYAKAQYNLGVNYENGLGITKDYTQAAYWYQKAAVQGHVLAQHNLGLFYHNGRGVARDERKAIALLSRAAATGHEPSQRALWRIQNPTAAAGEADIDAAVSAVEKMDLHIENTRQQNQPR
jgi:TPR repeat protein